MSSIFDGPVIRSLYKQLVGDFGGVDAAAAFLGCSKGTISKEISGQLNPATGHWGKLEDALDRYPITSLLEDRRRERRESGKSIELIRQLIKENGDVPDAVFKLIETGDATAAIKEIRESIAAGKSLLEKLEAEGGFQNVPILGVVK